MLKSFPSINFFGQRRIILSGKNFGEKGYEFNNENWGEYESFRSDVINQCGEFNSDLFRYVYLMPINDKHYRSGNVEWRVRRRCNLSFTEPGNLI